MYNPNMNFTINKKLLSQNSLVRIIDDISKLEKMNDGKKSERIVYISSELIFPINDSFKSLFI